MWGIVILAVFGTITTIISTIFYKTRDRQIEEEILRPSSKELDLLRAKENELLHTYGFIDQQKMIVHIPIEEAMKKEVEIAAQRTYP